MQSQYQPWEVIIDTLIVPFHHQEDLVFGILAECHES